MLIEQMIVYKERGLAGIYSFSYDLEFAIFTVLQTGLRTSIFPAFVPVFFKNYHYTIVVKCLKYFK